MNFPHQSAGKPIKPAYKTDRKPLFPALAARPKCSSDLLFIWDAIDLAGRAILGEDWNGDEMQVLDWPISPENGVALQEEWAERQKAILKDMPSWVSGRRTDCSEQTPRPMQHNGHVHAWHKHRFNQRVKAEQYLWEQNQTTLGRLRRATDWLDLQFRDGKVRTLTRFTDLPVDPMEMPPSEWFCEDSFNLRFVPGQYERWFFTTSPPRKAPVYIFVDRQSLDRCLNIEPDLPKISDIDADSLSPYLRLAIAVAEAEEITESYHSKVDQLTEAILEMAPRFGLTVGGKQGDDLSRSSAVEIAKAIRWPSARAGRGKCANQKP